MGFERGSVGKISWFCCSPCPSRGDDIHLDLGGLEVNPRGAFEEVEGMMGEKPLVCDVGDCITRCRALAIRKIIKIRSTYAVITTA